MKQMAQSHIILGISW